jgi:chromosome segregation ATPase
MTESPHYGDPQPSRLDRIEATLARIAESQERTQQQINSNARAIEANSRSITELRVGIEVLGELLRTVFSELMDRLEAIEGRLDSEGDNGGVGG